MNKQTGGINRPVDTSVLMAPASFWGILILLGIAIWYSFWPLMMVSFFLLSLYLIIHVWTKLSLRGVEVTLTLNAKRVFAGNTFEWTAVVNNNKWMPLVWLEWDFADSTGVWLDDQESTFKTLRFLWIMWFGEARWTQKAKAISRGVYELGDVILRSGDGFRFAEKEESRKAPNTLYIYPSLKPVQLPPIHPAIHWAAEGRKGGILEDPLMVRGLREYQPGDELRRINWRASARTGKWHTNLYQPVVAEEMMIFLDVDEFISPRDAALDEWEQERFTLKELECFEDTLSLAASLGVTYHQRGMRIGFASNACNYRQKDMPLVRPASEISLFLDQLAQITPKLGSTQKMTLDKIVLHKEGLKPLFIFCRTITEKHLIWYHQSRDKLPQVRFYYRDHSLSANGLQGIAIPVEQIQPQGRREDDQ